MQVFNAFYIVVELARQCSGKAFFADVVAKFTLPIGHRRPENSSKKLDNWLKRK